MQRRQFTATGMGTALSAFLASFPLASWAQDTWPSKPIKLIVPFPPGGPTDIMGRTAAKVMGDKLGQQLVVENKAGAGGNIGTDAVAKAAGDGYTIGLSAISSLAIAPTLYPKLPFSVEKDLAPVSLVGFTPCAIVAHPSAPFDDLKGLIAYAKANPDKVSYASSGSGTSIHMAGELFKLRTGLKTQHIPYKGSAPALTDLMAGQVQFMFDNMPSSWPHVMSGKLKALAVTTNKRSPTAPDLPTMEESGIKPFDVSSWFGLIAPAGTPPEVVQKLNAAMNKAFDKPEVKEAYAKLGAVSEKNTPEQFGAFIKSEVASWAPVVKSSGATVD